jgi:hypothetical protein
MPSLLGELLGLGKGFLGLDGQSVKANHKSPFQRVCAPFIKGEGKAEMREIKPLGRGLSALIFDPM